MRSLRQQTREIFKTDGLLSRVLDRYEPRTGQQKMAAAVAEILAGGKLVVEAETGIGKTLAYLIPAVLSGQKVVISTNTLNLQDQIIQTEIPFIQNHIDPDLSVLCVKGRQNYLCRYRWQQFYAHQQLELFDSAETAEKIKEWLGTTTTGDRAELDWLEDNSPLWHEISATPGQCLGSKCPEDKRCFINELRRKAAKAGILIVNHHLFFSDLALRREGPGEVLPRYESVIFDEAHNLENVATSFFGYSFSHFQMLDLAKDVKLAAARLSGAKQKKIILAAEALHDRSGHFANIFPSQPGKFPLQEFIDDCHDWENEIHAVAERLSGLESALLANIQEDDTWQPLTVRCQEMHTRLLAAAGLHEIPDEGTYIRWYERREKSVVLTASPVDIALELCNTLYPHVRSAVFTSGTLTVGGDFSYFLTRLGLDSDTETLSLASPFDYANRTVLYIPSHSSDNPFPQPDQVTFSERIPNEIRHILMASEGRALVLFTSLYSMRNTYPFLAENLPYPVFMQGQAPRHQLLEAFRSQTNSVLLAVASFWEGINVPGESLSCVIIDKLPFEVPSDPVIMARIERIRKEGGNPFMDFQLPRAVLALRQGLGRLMRTSTDKGLLAILDIRLFTKRYGRKFLDSLPPSPIIRKLSEVESYFTENL